MHGEIFDGRRSARVAALVMYCALGIFPALVILVASRALAVLWLVLTLPVAWVCFRLATQYQLTIGPDGMALEIAGRRTNLRWQDIERVEIFTPAATGPGGRGAAGPRGGRTGERLVAFPRAGVTVPRRTFGPRLDPHSGGLIFWGVRQADRAPVEAALRRCAGDRYHPA